MLQLRPGLSFAFLGECAVLLDLDADRYFLLDGEPLRILRDAIANRLDPRQSYRFERLGPLPLLVDGAAGVAPVSAIVPTRSALEAPSALSTDHNLGQLFAAQWRTSFALRFRGLHGAVARWRALRPPVPILGGGEDGVALAQFYAAKRTLVPLRRSCVPDSFAFMRLLWRHRLDADLFFGVRLDPFAAHCWVQAGDLVLSDPLSSVADFTPVFRL